MPMPAPSRPRAPAEACGRSCSIGTGARPRSARTQLSARDRSAAVSARVPSKSKSTAVAPWNAASAIFRAAEQVVHVAIIAETVFPRERVVGHALQLQRPQARVAAPARELRRTDEALVVVRALRQHAEQILGAHHR